MSRPIGTAIWTPDEDAQLTALWLSGRASPDIAGAMGKTKGQVIGRAHRLKLPSHALSINVRGWTPDEDAQLRAGWASKQSARQIGETVGRSTAAVEGRAKKLGLGRRTARIVNFRSAAAPFRPMLSKAKAKAKDNAAAAAIRRERPAAPRYMGPNACQWIEDEPTADDSCKCGAPRISGSPYCGEHHARAWVRPRVEAQAA